ncbi:MAG: efflux RND transporter permease subunit [Halothiobacillaceae bacterium]
MTERTQATTVNPGGRRNGGGFLACFVHHRVAANLVMLIMILGGIFGVMRMNIQFFPNFALDVVTVRVVWTGASAEDIERGITIPLEQRLRSIANLHKISSTSAQGISSISLEFREGVDPVLALDDVRQQVDDFQNLPADAEKPQVSRVVRYEPIARVLIHGDIDMREMRMLVDRFERDLVARGVDRVSIEGLPEEQIAIEVPAGELERIGLSLDLIADRVADWSTDLPAGVIGEQDTGRELRAVEQARTVEDFADIPLTADRQERILLGDVAHIQREARDGQIGLYHEGAPAVELLLERAETGDSLASARVLESWLADVEPILPPGVDLTVYDQSWQLIDERISLLVKNGFGGLVLVMILLYLFLPARVALWVAIGIPTAFMAALAVLWGVGGSINMISLFALIMALGVIVDDAIVVGEDADAHYRAGESPQLASEGAARRMLWPVVASSLTTVAAFMPLLAVGGIIGNILGDIPLVMICVLIASLLECFVVLPAHLRNAFRPQTAGWSERLRERFDNGFTAFRQGPFRRLVRASLANRATTLASAATAMILVIGLLAGGRLGFTFFPTPEPQILYANATFVAGTPPERVSEFMRSVEQALAETEAQLGGDLVQTAMTREGGTIGAAGTGARGDQLGSMLIEMTSPDDRSVRNTEFIREWRSRIQEPPGLENFIISQREGGPPGKDVNIRLTGEDADQLKAAAVELSSTLGEVPGVLDTEDDMPYGREQLIFSVNSYGEALGLTTRMLANQLRAAFDGRLTQIFQDGPDEIEVRVMLPRAERERMATRQRLSIRLPDGRFVPLEQVARFETRQGFEALRHAETELAVEVTAEVNRAINSAANILASLEKDTLPDLAGRYNVQYSFEGRAADQRETMEDMKFGLYLGLAMMYIVLVWVFASWTTPLIVMAIIPFGLVGALLGHWLMGLDVTILSMFGLFGLSGIVVNNAIILVSFYKLAREKGLSVNEALEEASVQRVRAVLLTSLTTIGGLLPLMFETSLQAQFLIPMAASITFGLGFATLLVLLVIPALVSVQEGLRQRFTSQAHQAQ